MITTEVLDLPFNKYLGITRAVEPGYLLQLKESPNYQNHLGTIHASAQLALAEASCAECLVKQFPELRDDFLVVVRKVQAKFKHPLQGIIRSKASIRQHHSERPAKLLQRKNGLLFFVDTEISDANGKLGLLACIEWFIHKQSHSDVLSGN